MALPIDKRTREGLYNRACGAIGDRVMYQGRVCQIMGRYWRYQTNEILYDLREASHTQASNTLYPKVPHKDVNPIR